MVNSRVDHFVVVQKSILIFLTAQGPLLASWDILLMYSKPELLPYVDHLVWTLSPYPPVCCKLHWAMISWRHCSCAFNKLAFIKNDMLVMYCGRAWGYKVTRGDGSSSLRKQRGGWHRLSCFKTKTRTKAELVKHKGKHSRNKIRAKFYILLRNKQAETINRQEDPCEFIKREYSESKIPSMGSKIPRNLRHRDKATKINKQQISKIKRILSVINKIQTVKGK